MKKLLAYAVLAGALLVGCAEDEPEAADPAPETDTTMTATADTTATEAATEAATEMPTETATSDDGDATGTAAADATGTETGFELSEEDCVEVSPEVIEAITAGLTVDDGSLRAAHAVEAVEGPVQSAGGDDGDSLWYVAADIEGTDFEAVDDIATWTIDFPPDGTETEGTILAADAIAASYSEFEGTDDTGGNDPAARAAQECARTAAS